MQRRLAAILAADIVGYTRLMGADEAGTLRRVKQQREEILEPLVAVHHGRVVKLMGDGLLSEFASIVDAMNCAIDWQAKVRETESDLAEESQIKFRIGVNIGDVIIEDDDIFCGVRRCRMVCHALFHFDWHGATVKPRRP